MIRKYLYLILAAALSCACDLIGIESPDPGGETPSQKDPDTVIITPKELNVGAEGGTFEITIEHNVDVDVTVGDDYWYTVATKAFAATRYLDSDILVVIVESNPSGQPRDGGFTVSSTAGTERVKVHQEAADVFSLSETSAEVPYSGGSFSVTVTGSGDYHISSIPDWISETSRQDRTHTVTAEPTPDALSRDGVIVFCDEGGVCLPFAVRQQGLPSWPASQFKHTSLVMRFTATWCGWCPRMNKSVHKAQESYPGKLLHLALHGNGSDLYFNQTNALMTQYQIQGYPTGIVDGRIEVANGDITATANRIVSVSKETEKLYGTVTGAAVSSSLGDGKIDMDITLYVKEAGDYKLTVLLVEDGINNAQTDYEDGDHSSYTHDGVARLAVTSVSGDAFTVNNAPAEVGFSLSARLDGKWNASNVRILGYVQAKYGTRTKKRTANYGEYYVDNCFIAVPGVPLTLQTE